MSIHINSIREKLQVLVQFFPKKKKAQILINDCAMEGSSGAQSAVPGRMLPTNNTEAAS